MKETVLLQASTARPRSYMQTVDALRQEISNLGLVAGDRLPPERELAKILKISRPSLREALIVLELQGEIDIKVGSGIYLRHVTPVVTNNEAAETKAHAEISLMGHSPADVSQMRMFLESSVASHAARFITSRQLKILKTSINSMVDALDQRKKNGDEPLASADRLFHITLASSVENPLLAQTIEELFDQRYTPIGGSLHRLFDKQLDWHDAIKEHQEIYEAIAERDPLQAQAAMQRHLKRANKRLMRAIG